MKAWNSPHLGPGCAAGLLLLLAAATPPVWAASGAARPNVILMLADDLGYGDLGCYPHRGVVSTPNIDRLAAEGVRMTHAYAAFPVCSPTRTALMTGRYPQRDGVYGNVDGTQPGARPGLEMLPVRLQRAGYRTGWLGKWHLGWDVSNHPMNNGFDVAFGFLGGMHDYFDPAEGDHYIGGPFARHAWVFDGFTPVQHMDYLTREITRRSAEFIRSTPRSQPFFLYLAYNAPHTPFEAPDDAIRRRLRSGEAPEAAVRRAMIDELDASVGSVLDVLREQGLEGNTLVVFASDNGATSEAHNGPLRGKKMTLWEGGSRVPVIARWPGILPAGKTCAALSFTPDLTATTLALADVTVPTNRIDGVNLMPFWTGQRTGDAHEALVWCLTTSGGAGVRPTLATTPRWAVRQGPWKLIRDQEEAVRGLFNLQEDEGEQNNLETKHPDRVAALTRIYESWLQNAAPSSGAIQRLDTRADGDRLKLEALREHCQRLLSEKPLNEKQK